MRFLLQRFTQDQDKVLSFRKFPIFLRTLSHLLCDSSYKTLIKYKFFILIYSHTCTIVYIKHDNLILMNSCFTLTISRTFRICLC